MLMSDPIVATGICHRPDGAHAADTSSSANPG
jgi:hypothetical protein